MTKSKSFIYKLIEPADSVTDIETRQNSRLLMTMLIVIAPVGLFFLMVYGIKTHGAAFFNDNDFYAMMGGFVVWGIAYFMSRKGYFKQGVALSVLTGLLVIFFAAVLDRDGGMGELSYLVFPVLLSSIVLPIMQTSLFVLISAAAILLAPVINPASAYGDVILGPLTFLGIGYSVILLINKYRDNVQYLRESVIKEKEDRYRKLIEEGYGGLCVVSEGRILEANAGFLALFGESSANISGMKFTDLVIPDHRETVLQGLSDIGKNSLEVFGENKDGEPFLMELLISKQHQNGKTTNFIAVRDVSRETKKQDEFEQITKDLAQSQNLFKALSRIAISISSLVDPNEILEFVGAELKALDLACSISLLDEEKRVCVLDYISIGSDELKKIGEKVGVPLTGFKMEREQWNPEMVEVLKNGNHVFVDDFLAFVANFIPIGIKTLSKNMLQMGNITENTHAQYLPLMAEGSVFGDLVIWGNDLRSEDSQIYMIFANQVASIYENARLQKNDEDQASEILRANELVKALSRVSIRVMSAVNTEEVGRFLGEELNKIGLFCAISSMTADRQTIIFESISVDSHIIERIEKIGRVSLSDFTVTREFFSPQAVEMAKELKPIYLPSFREAIEPFFLGTAGPLIREMAFKIAGMPDDMPGLFHPFPLYEDKIGFLNIWGDSFKERDIPAFTFFCSQIQSCLERIRLHHVEKKQLNDLQKAGNLVNALTNVTKKINRTYETKAVLETLGRELKELGLECLVARIDHAKDIGYIEYHSMDPKLLRAATKYTKLTFENHRVPLENWPSFFLEVFNSGVSKYCEKFDFAVAEFIPLPKSIALKAVSMVGISEDTPGLILPLNQKDFSLGCLTIWGDTLRPEDIKTYALFSEQVAGAFESAQLYENQQAQATELARANNVVTNLSAIAASITSHANEDDLLARLENELSKIGLNYALGIREKDEDSIHIIYVSLPGVILDKLTKLTGIEFRGKRLPFHSWPEDLANPAEHGRPLFFNQFEKFVNKFLPAELRLLGGNINRLVGISENTPAMLLALLADQKSQGILAVWGDELEENDLYSYQIFANEISALLENARVRESELAQAEELARSITVVNALSKMSDRISSSTDPDDVLHILGEELNKLGLECLVTFLTPDRQVGYARYLSYGADTIGKLTKLTGVRLEKYHWPREIWPESSVRVFDDAEGIFLKDFSSEVRHFFPKMPEPIFKKGLNFLGVTANTVAYYLPLINDGMPFGSLTLWGKSVCEEDVPAYTAFAKQVANAFEKARLLDQAVDEITQRKKAQEGLEKSRLELRGLFENAHDAILVIDPVSEKILDANERACYVYGYFRDEFIGKSLREICKEMMRVRKHLDATLVSGSYQRFETIHICKDGQEMNLEINASVVDYQGKRAIQSINRDVTARKMYEEKLEHDALHDGLTNLPNRELFLARLNHIIARQKRNDEIQFAVIYLDLDQFKRINDSLGHIEGDKVLIAVGNKLQKVIRKTDIVARLGGDEFVILLEEISGKVGVLEFCDRLMNILWKPMRIGEQEYSNTASLGIVFSSPEYESPEEYLRDADIAMYKAKELGKQRYVVYDESMHDDVCRKLSLENQMRVGLENNEFFLEYQPIYSIQANQIKGYEALVRWNSPEKGLIPPMDFIHFAEESRIIHNLGKWVLTEACRQFYQWIVADSEFQSKTISVNVSPVQLLHPRFAETVVDVIRESGLAPENLCLEITETAIISAADIVESALRKVNAIGVKIHMDDFGTGYASLGFLSRFPIDAVKIDRSFINEIEKDKNSVLVRGIVFMSHELGLQVIAEGVETPSQLEVLLNMNCESAQGYYFSKPVRMEEISLDLKNAAKNQSSRK